MKIIYVHTKNSYAAIVAAYMHLKLKAIEDIHRIENNYKEEGSFYYLGMDENLNEIYLMYTSKNSYILENLLEGFAKLYGEEIQVINMG